MNAAKTNLPAARTMPAESPPMKPPSRLTAQRWQLAAPATLVLGLLATVFFADFTHRAILEKARAQFVQAVDATEWDVRDRLEGPIDGLRGALGAAAAAQGLNRAAFKRFMSTHNLHAEFPGVRGLGFIERVARDQLPALLDRERADEAPDFSVKTKGDAADLLVIKYIEPLDNNRRAWGYDVGQEARRRAATERAINTGEPALTRRVTLVQDATQGPGFLLFVPSYRPGASLATPEQRRAALEGLFYSPIVAAEILAPLAHKTRERVEFAIYDDADLTPANRIYPPHAGPWPNRKTLLSDTRTIEVAGQTLILTSYSSPAFEASVDRSPVFIVLIGGALLSLTLALTLGALVSGRSRAEALARAMTADLDRLAKVARYTTSAVLITDAEMRITWANRAGEMASGYPLHELLGVKPGLLAASAGADDSGRALLRAIEAVKAFRGEVLALGKEGSQWWDVDLQPQYNTEGEHCGFVIIQTDITQRKQEQETLHIALEKSDALLASINQLTIVSMSDGSGVITEANEAFCAISGYSRNELLGNRHSLLDAGVQPREFFAQLWQTIATGKPWRGEICNRTKQGELYWVDTIIAPVNDGQEGAINFISFAFDITRQKQVQTQLHASERLLDRAGKIASFGAWEIDVPHHSLRWSNEMRALHELDAQFQPAMAGFLRFYAPESRLIIGPAFKQALATGIGWDLELEVITAQGNRRWVRSVAEADGPERLVGTLQDITAMREVQQTQQQLLRRLDVATASAGIGIWEFDPATRKLVGDERMFGMYGLSGEQDRDAYQLWDHCLGSDHSERVKQELLLALRGTKDFATECRTVWPNGQQRHLKSFARVIRDEQGRPQRVYGVNLDITDLKKAEQDQRDTSAFLGTVLDSASEIAIIGTDLALNITVFNRGAERLLGYRADELLDVCTPATFHLASEMEARGRELSAQYGYEISGPAVFNDPHLLGNACEWTYVHKNGHQIAVSLCVTQMLGANGEPLGYLGIATDITQLKQFERSMRLAAELAEQGSLAKSRFLSNMSHEIRTPMNAILGMLTLLNRTDLNAKQQDYLSKTQGAAQSLLGLINDILDFSKIEAGKLNLDPRPFSLNTLLSNLSVIMAANLHDKPLELLFDLDAELPDQLNGDDTRLQQVLINLAGNAVKFTASGEVCITLRLLAQQPGAVHVEIAVTDTGIGIAVDQQAHVFAGFSQAEAATTRRYGGTGLGLAISQKLISLMGGELTLTSELGRGSCFSFSLWLRTAPQAYSQPAGPARRVLIVDDHAKALDLFGRMTHSLNWQASLVGSGTQALSLFCETQRPPHFDALIIDYAMPGLDGLQTHQGLAALSVDALPPVIFLGHQQSDMPTHTESAVHWLAKPLTASMLSAAVERALNPNRQTALAPSQRLTGLHLLLVEDNLNNQQVAFELLTEQGAVVTLANNGQEGVEAVMHARFDAVLMDLQMPVMDGYTATQQIRQRYRLEQLVVIAMTANALTIDRDSCIEAGMNDHVGKPFVLEQLIACILQHTRPNIQQALSDPMPEPLAVEAPSVDLAIEMDKAVAMMGGRQSLYTRLFKRFLSELAATLIEFQQLLQAEQFVDAHRQMHTLKGLCATLGLTHLNHVAAELEHELKTPITSEQSTLMLKRWGTAIEEASPGMVALGETLA